jgi:predicted FMN-binding regulatory protein PaiB
MYVPDHFKVSNRRGMLSFLDTNAFGQLISVEDNRSIDNLDKQGSAALVRAMRKALS